MGPGGQNRGGPPSGPRRDSGFGRTPDRRW
jgi:hypothetical protein